MNKELLNKILPYCGHGVFAYQKEQESTIDEIVGFFENGFDFKHWSPFDMGKMENYKLVLFSPNCLTREIETEYGKEVPLIELAKLCNNCGYTPSGFKCDGKDEKWYYVKCYSNPKGNNGYLFYQFPVNVNKISIKEAQYLYSRHIAFNLFPDEYVDVQDLKENPYKIKQQ